jgi:hypothetical protein
MSNDLHTNDLDDFESDELTPAMRAQLRQIEQSYHRRQRDRSRVREQRREVMRRLDEWRDARRLRDEVDYIR